MVVTFTMEKMPGILVNIFMLLNNFNIIYVGWHKPYDSFAQNTIELFNLSMLNVLSYHLLLLANLMETPEHEYLLGWSIIACIAVFFIVNMSYMLSLTLRKLFRQVAIKLLKIKRDRLVKKIDQRKNAMQPQLNFLISGGLRPHQLNFGISGLLRLFVDNFRAGGRHLKLLRVY